MPKGCLNARAMVDWLWCSLYCYVLRQSDRWKLCILDSGEGASYQPDSFGVGVFVLLMKASCASLNSPGPSCERHEKAVWGYISSLSLPKFARDISWRQSERGPWPWEGWRSTCGVSGDFLWLWGHKGTACGWHLKAYISCEGREGA